MADELQNVDGIRRIDDEPEPVRNPDFDPGVKERSWAVTASMEADGFYADHTLEECRVEWRARYDGLIAEGS